MKPIYKTLAIGIGLTVFSAASLLAGDSMPPVTVSGLHTQANWPNEMLGPWTFLESAEGVHPLDRSCVKKQLKE